MPSLRINRRKLTASLEWRIKMDLLFFFLALICWDIYETIIDHFDVSIFRRIENIFILAWFRSHWTRKYVNNDPNGGRKKFYGITLPPWDARHTSKWLALIFFYFAIRNFNADADILIHGLAFAGIIYWTHRLFYEYLLLLPEYRKPLL